MQDSKQRIRDRMLRDVPPHLQDSFVTGSVTVSPQTLGLLLSHMYCSPQNEGLVAQLCQSPRRAIELIAEPIQTVFRSPHAA